MEYGTLEIISMMNTLIMIINTIYLLYTLKIRPDMKGWAFSYVVLTIGLMMDIFKAGDDILKTLSNIFYGLATLIIFLAVFQEYRASNSISNSIKTKQQPINIILL